MENKKTALDWLINEIWGIDEPPLGIKLYYETAKQMEKQQIINAYNHNMTGLDKLEQEDIGLNWAEDYYNETFINGH